MDRVLVKTKIANDEVYYGPGVRELMDWIEETGSVRDACEKMGLSYSKAWTIINRAEHEVGETLVQRQHGGAAGGGCHLTDRGKDLLAKYKILEKDVSDYARTRFEKLFC